MDGSIHNSVSVVQYTYFYVLYEVAKSLDEKVCVMLYITLRFSLTLQLKAMQKRLRKTIIEVNYILVHFTLCHIQHTK